MEFSRSGEGTNRGMLRVLVSWLCWGSGFWPWVLDGFGLAWRDPFTIFSGIPQMPEIKVPKESQQYLWERTCRKVVLNPGAV